MRARTSPGRCEDDWTGGGELEAERGDSDSDLIIGGGSMTSSCLAQTIPLRSAHVIALHSPALSHSRPPTGPHLGPGPPTPSPHSPRLLLWPTSQLRILSLPTSTPTCHSPSAALILTRSKLLHVAWAVHGECWPHSPPALPRKPPAPPAHPTRQTPRPAQLEPSWPTIHGRAYLHSSLVSSTYIHLSAAPRPQSSSKYRM